MSFFGNDPFFHGFPSPAVHPGAQPGMQQRRQGPLIQELSEDEEHMPPADEEPKVEEPEEEEQGGQVPHRSHTTDGEHGHYENQQHQRPHYRPQQRGNLLDPLMDPFANISAMAPFGGPLFRGSLLGGPLMGPGSMFGVSLFGGMDPYAGMGANVGAGNVSGFSYSSSSYSSGGRRGVTYSKTTTTRIGPNGVAETHETVNDGRTGMQKTRTARRLGDREHIVASTTDARGYEERQETLNNIRDEEEKRRFQEEWEREAQHSLLGSRGRSNSLRSNSMDRPARQPRLAYHRQ